jgi:hypothetical protein
MMDQNQISIKKALFINITGRQDIEYLVKIVQIGNTTKIKYVLYFFVRELSAIRSRILCRIRKGIPAKQFRAANQ